MELVLVVTVLCLAAANAVLASSVPFIWWKCYRLEWRLAEEIAKLQMQIDTLDEALARLLEGIEVPGGES